MIRALLLLFFLMSISPNFVDGAQCKKSSFGWWTCSPCGKGTRCNYCSWCTGYCFNGHAGRSSGGVEYGSEEALYKLPFLEMFNDIEVLLNGDGISDLDVVALYKSISDVTREDCTICNNNPEINDLSIFAEEVHATLKKLVGTLQFKLKAIERTTETKKIVESLPDSLKIRVEPTSSILENIKEGK